MLKQDYEIEKQEDEDLRCPICNYYYSSITKPYLLPCNHNLCSLCIDKIINKKMLYCPLCRKTFSLEDREKFQVNFTFLNLVIKILKTKVIYCKKCSKIFNWTEHHLVCDQSQFKETNEIIEEIKTLIDDCIIFVKEKEQTVKLKENYLSDFFASLLKFQKEVEEIFCSKTETEIEQFYNNIPFLDIDLLYKELTNFVKICEPIYSSLNLNQAEIKNVIENLDKDPQKNEGNANEKYFNQQKDSNKFGKQNVFNFYNKDDFITKDSDNIPTIRKNFITPLTINIQNTVNKGLPKEEERQFSNQDDLSTNINFDKLNYIISIYKKISDITLKILNHTRQIEFTSETIKSQISNNYTKFNSKIYSDLNSVHDTITVSNPNTQKNLFIHYIENTRKIWLYNIISNKCEIIEFNVLTEKFNSSISIDFDEKNNFIFLSGGKFNKSISIFSDESFISNQLKIFQFRKNLSENDISLYQMPRRRAFHSSIYFENKLYIVGGKNEKGNLKETECYNIKEKIWELMPNMKYARLFPTLCIFNCSYLYAFRGNEEESNSHVEFINIHNLSSEWICVKIEDPGRCFSPVIKSGACVLNQNMIMICGGYNNLQNGMISNCFIYNPIKKTVYRSKDMAKSAYFSHGGIKNEDQNKVYIIDDKNETGETFGIHIYDINKHIWTYNS